MTEEETMRKREEEIDFLPVVDGELVEISPVENDEPEELTVVSAKNKTVEKRSEKPIANQTSQIANQKIYLLLPFIFLTVALLGGLRLASPDNAFVFWRPALFCLIAAEIRQNSAGRQKTTSLPGAESRRPPSSVTVRKMNGKSR